MGVKRFFQQGLFLDQNIVAHRRVKFSAYNFFLKSSSLAIINNFCEKGTCKLFCICLLVCLYQFLLKHVLLFSHLSYQPVFHFCLWNIDINPPTIKIQLNCAHVQDEWRVCTETMASISLFSFTAAVVRIPVRPSWRLAKTCQYLWKTDLTSTNKKKFSICNTLDPCSRGQGGSKETNQIYFSLSPPRSPP